MKRLLSIILSVLFSVFVANAQITGQIVDEAGFPIAYASAIYKGHHVASVSDIDGKFSIARHEGWVLTLSSVGYKPKEIKIDSRTPSHLNVVLNDEETRLNEVVVKAKRGKYSRKNNPAVELMKRVIAAKKKTNLGNHDFYQYNKYQKISLAFNDIRPEDMTKEPFKGSPAMIDQLETSPYNNKIILPVSVEETVSQHIYSKNPHSEKDIVKGQQSEGINKLLATGEGLNVILKDVFQDIDIYDDYIRLFQIPFVSPIGSGAIAFYRYYIEDTVYVDRDLCFHLQFIPNNQQDFGFRGELFVVADSSLHVKKCKMTIPKKSDVNFVDDMNIDHEYTQLENGEWVLSKDDLWTELSLTGSLMSVLVVRNTRLSDYAFDPLPKQLFKGSTKVFYDADAAYRGKSFWNKYRTVELTEGESKMAQFVHQLEQNSKYKWLILGLKTLVENFIETGNSTQPSKFDFGPINTLVSKNYVDGYRLRVGGRTMGALSPHFFWEGYIARGLKSHENYYGSKLIYSINKKKISPFEFPRRSLELETTYDVMSPSDLFLTHDKDNIFMSVRSNDMKQMYFYNRQRLSFVYETYTGLQIEASLKTQSNRAAGEMHFNLLNDSSEVNKFRTTELQFGVTFRPGQTYINTKQRRVPVNFDAPVVTLSHTLGLNNFLGGNYQLNYTQLGLSKRQWLGSFGFVDLHLQAGAQWNKVPFPMLIMPPVNLSYFSNEISFSLMRNMEFLNDRYAFWSVSWDMNGKLFNRIPLIRKLKWREWISFKGMFGRLTDKNNPFLDTNKHDKTLFHFPKDVNLMNKNIPYMELSVGIHNIFKFLQVEYVHRFNYNEHPGVRKDGVRFNVLFSF